MDTMMKLSRSDEYIIVALGKIKVNPVVVQQYIDRIMNDRY